MSGEKLRPKHLVMIRHGESEGDLRRAQGRKLKISDKHPKDEEQTWHGHEQSMAAGLWVSKHILQGYKLQEFDAYLVSPLSRTKQSANSSGLTTKWQEEPRISERDRGNIQGLTRLQHEELFPDSYQQMLEHPFYWTPPGGESLLRVSSRLTELLFDVSAQYDNAVLVTHRDVLWAAHLPLDGLDTLEIETVDTDQIGNGHIFHYTNVSPYDGSIEDKLRWKQSIDPCDAYQDLSGSWTDLDRTEVSV